MLPPQPEDELKMMQELVRNGTERCSIGATVLWIYPDVSFHTQRFITEKPTLGSWGVYDWGTMPYDITLQGTTGISGLRNLDTDPQSIRQIRPMHGSNFSVLDFRYPGRFQGALKVRVLDVQDSRTSQNKFIWYTIALKVYPDFVSSYRKISTTPTPGPDQALTYPNRKGPSVT